MTRTSHSTPANSSRPGTFTQRPHNRRPDPARLAVIAVRAWMEIAAGRRPFAQLRPLLSPALARQLGCLLRSHHARAHIPLDRVRNVRVQWPTADAIEAVVVVGNDRVTAFAVRAEHHQGAWRVVDLVLPGSGVSQIRTASAPSVHQPMLRDSA